MKIGRRQMKVEVPSVAMGDIAFNLIVFFVILARAQDDSHLQWTPPTTPKVEAADYPKATIVIDVRNKLFLDGREIGIAALADAVEERLGDAPGGRRTVQLKAHRDIQAARFEPVIEAISEAGGDLFLVLEEKKQP